MLRRNSLLLGSSGCPTPGKVQDQARWGFAYLAGGVPAHGRGVGTGWSLSSLPSQNTLWFLPLLVNLGSGRLQPRPVPETGAPSCLSPRPAESAAPGCWPQPWSPPAVAAALNSRSSHAPTSPCMLFIFNKQKGSLQKPWLRAFRSLHRLLSAKYYYYYYFHNVDQLCSVIVI